MTLNRLELLNTINVIFQRIRDHRHRSFLQERPTHHETYVCQYLGSYFFRLYPLLRLHLARAWIERGGRIPEEMKDREWARWGWNSTLCSSPSCSVFFPRGWDHDHELKLKIYISFRRPYFGKEGTSHCLQQPLCIDEWDLDNCLPVLVFPVETLLEHERVKVKNG